MRLLHSWVCLTPSVLLQSVGYISVISGTTVTTYSATVESVGGNQHDTTANRLLRADETSNDEDRMEHVGKAVSTSIKSMYSRVFTSDEEKLKSIVTNNGHILNVLLHEDLNALAKVYEKKKRSLYEALLTLKVDEVKLADALIEMEASLKETTRQVAKQLTNEQIHYWIASDKSYSDVFSVMINRRPFDVPALGRKIPVLSTFLRLKNNGQQDDARLFYFLNRRYTDLSLPFAALLATSQSLEEAKALETRLYEYLSKTGPLKEIVKRLFDYGEMEKRGVHLLRSAEMDMLIRFYKKSRTKLPPDNVLTARVLRRAFMDDGKVALFIAKAMESPTKDVQNLEIGFFKDLENAGMPLATVKDKAYHSNDKNHKNDRKLLDSFIERLTQYNAFGRYKVKTEGERIEERNRP